MGWGLGEGLPSLLGSFLDSLVDHRPSSDLKEVRHVGWNLGRAQNYNMRGWG